MLARILNASRTLLGADPGAYGPAQPARDALRRPSAGGRRAAHYRMTSSRSLWPRRLASGARPWRAWAGATSQTPPNGLPELAVSWRAWAGDVGAGAQAHLH